MITNNVKRNSFSQMGNAGLTLIGEMARISGLYQLANNVSKTKKPNISDAGNIRTLCGLLFQGKTDFDHVNGYQNDFFFMAPLGLNRGFLCRETIVGFTVHPIGIELHINIYSIR